MTVLSGLLGLALSLISLAPAANAQFCYHHPCPGELSDTSSYQQQQSTGLLEQREQQFNQQQQYYQWQRDQYDRDLWRLWLQNHWNDRRP